MWGNKSMPPTNLETILLTCRSRKNSFFFKSALTSSLLVSNLKSFDGWQDSPFDLECIHWTKTYREFTGYTVIELVAGYAALKNTHTVLPLLSFTDNEQLFPFFSYSCDEGHAGGAPRWESQGTRPSLWGQRGLPTGSDAWAGMGRIERLSSQEQTLSADRKAGARRGELENLPVT